MKDRKKIVFYMVISLLSFVIFFSFQKLLSDSGVIFVIETIWMLLCIIAAFLFFDKSLVDETKALISIKNKKKIIVVLILFSFVAVKIVCSIYVTHIVKSFPKIGRIELMEYIILYSVAGIYEELLFKRGIYGALCYVMPKKVFSILLCSVIFFLFHFRFSLISAFALILYQLFTLMLFELYPNILTFGIFHALWNIALWI
ncbi:MAG: hypothetical protein K5829_13460 [Treponema sp.]|nr:hypothetical protein [Treponema sp.]